MQNSTSAMFTLNKNVNNAGMALFFRVFDQFDNFFQLIGADLFFIGEEGNQVLIRILEIIAHKAVHKTLFIIFLLYSGCIAVGVAHLFAVEETFALEVFDGRRKRSIRWLWFSYLVKKILYRSRAALPYSLHCVFFL